jgi:predicted aldo/keto reductase-like oxidoreductase
MRLPQKEGTHEIDRVLAGEMVDYALSRGVNYFDTAYMYHDGMSESFAGEALSKHERSSFKLATKMPLMMLKAESDVDRIFKEQLQKCRTDYFDFYLLHNINRENWRIAEDFKVYEKLKEKQRQGQIRHLGFSFHDYPELLQEVTRKYDWDFAQIQLNYMDWELQKAKEQYTILTERGIPVSVMEPIRGGALATLCDDSIAIFKAANPDASPASWALRFAASLSGVQVVLSGMSTMEQVRDNIHTMENFKPLKDEERKVIEKALIAYGTSGSVPCTGCRYCMDCPQGIDIPRALAIYNSYLFNKARNRPNLEFFFSMEYRVLGEERQAHRCVQCNQCTEHCPQRIEIPRHMGAINALHQELASKQS